MPAALRHLARRPLVLAGLSALLVALVALPAPAASAATPLGRFECLGFSGLDNASTIGGGDLARFAMDDRFKPPGRAALRVGNGRGNITWSQPQLGVSGQTWLNSLKWLGSLLDASAHRHSPVTSAQRNHVLSVVRDWADDHPAWEKADPRSASQGPVASAAHRLQFLDCLRNETGGIAWLDALIARHVAFLIGPDPKPGADRRPYVVKTWHPAVAYPRWNGPNNRGLDQSLAVLGAACEIGRTDWYAVALRRIGKHAAVVYDAQGVDNEQAPGYSVYNLGLWTKTLDRLRQCGGSGQSAVEKRLANAVEFIAMAHRPDGHIEQLGDTEDARRDFAGNQAEYAATQGRAGVRPTGRVGIYDSATNGGYVFGHSGWGVERPFAQESFYSLRFGRGRTLHGHDDHTSVTYWAKGQQILADGGHAGYEKGAYRNYILSPEAHNVVTASATFDRLAPTVLTRSATGAGGDSFTMRDTAYSGVTRQRSVLAVLPNAPDVLLVADFLTSPTRHRYDQLWHLGPQLPAGLGGGRVTASNAGLDVSVVPIVLPGDRAPDVSLVRGQQKPLQGWVSKRFYTHTPTSTVQVRATGATARIVTAVVPAATGSAVTTAAVASPAGGWDVTVTVGGVPVVAHLSASGELTR